MSSNTRGGWMWPSDVAKGRSQIEAVTAGVDEGAGGQMGLAKTSGADEGGSEIKVEAGADDTGMGITGLWAELFTVMSTSWGCCRWFRFLYECITEIKLSRCGRLLLLIYICELNFFRPPNWSACFFPPSRLRSPYMKIHHINSANLPKNWQSVLKFLRLTTTLLFNLAL